MTFVDSLKGKSKTIFFVAALILILNNIAAAMNAFTDLAALGAALKEVLQVLGYGTAFVGGLALFATLSEEGGWLARIAALLEVLAVIGTAILAVAYTLSLLGILNSVPDPVRALGFGVLLGQLGLALLGIAVLRSGAYSAAAGFTLILPFLIFVFSLVGAGIFGEDAVPAYVPFLTVTAQTLAHVAIAFTLPAEPAVTETAQAGEASLA
jgi:hypothetical protein